MIGAPGRTNGRRTVPSVRWDSLSGQQSTSGRDSLFALIPPPSEIVALLDPQAHESEDAVFPSQNGSVRKVSDGGGVEVADWVSL